MATFCVNISEDSISHQIAEMLNRYNELGLLHNALSIKNNITTKYFVEVAFPGQVIACVALHKVFNGTYIKHLCVKPEYRRMGIAKKLINQTLTNVENGIIFMDIRDNNIPSLKIAHELGFSFINKRRSSNGDHFVIKVGRVVR